MTERIKESPISKGWNLYYIIVDKSKHVVEEVKRFTTLEEAQQLIATNAQYGLAYEWKRA